MKQNSRFFSLIVLIVFSLHAGSAQYDVERVMEKSFEHTDFFFMPYRFVPFGIGAFKNSVSGMLNDPFLELDVNPARLFRDSSGAGYFVADFRNAREVTDYRNAYYPYPMLRTAAMDMAYRMPYPQYYLNTRRELEPAVSLAYLFRPFSGSWDVLSLGATYQLVTQDEDYYAIPQDVYRSVMGADYKGDRAAGTENIPIVDRYSGADEMLQQGHFVSLFAGADLTQQLQVGTKIGRVVFDREGSYGSSNVWKTGSSSSTSFWRNLESRKQSYGHWEGSLGLRYSLTTAASIGISALRLEGSADQSLPRRDSSYYSYGTIDSDIDDWGIYSSAGEQDQFWNHDGETTIIGADFSAWVTPERRLQFTYQFARQEVDISLSGTVRDGSNGRSRWGWDTTEYRYQSSFGLSDIRTGRGSIVATTQRLTGTYQWKLGDRVFLSLGGQFETRESETKTNESVVANRYSRYQSTGSNPYSSFDSTSETKQLRWTFRTNVMRLTIPVFVTYRASESVELMFGLNRRASNWEAEDVTLAIFDERVYHNQGGSTTESGFGERYTQPRERMSEVRTTFMAGLTVSPTPSLSIRFLGVPNYIDTYAGSELSDFQLWISVSVRP